MQVLILLVAFLLSNNCWATDWTQHTDAEFVYLFNNGSSLTDNSPNTYTLTAVGSPTNTNTSPASFGVSGNGGYYYDLETGNGDYLYTANFSGDAGNQTATMWLTAETALNGYSSFVSTLSQWNSDENDRCWSFLIPHTGSANNVVADEINYIVSPDGAYDTNYSVSIPAADMASLNTWYHIAGRYDGSTIKIYLNGVEKDSLNYSGGIYTDSERVRIGTFVPATERWDGRVDEVAMFYTALDATDINNIYEYGLLGSEEEESDRRVIYIF